MGMSIEESIKELEILKKNTFSYMSAHQAFITAVNIMRKYEKIEQLIADYEEYKWERGVVCKREIAVKDIREIIDGNVD